MSFIVARTYVIAKKGGLDRSVLNNPQKQTQTISKNLSDSFLFFVLKYCQNIHIHIGRSYTISQKTLL